MSVRVFLAALVLLALPGCPSAEDDRLPSCTVPDEQDLNTLSGSVDGQDWVGATAGYQLIAGPALQVSATGQEALGDTVNVVLRLRNAANFSVDEETDEVLVETGDDIERVLDRAEVPYDFNLGDANTNGANATVTISPRPSMTTGLGDGGGFARITFLGVPSDAAAGAPEELIGCFHMDAESQDGSSTVRVDDGAFRLTAI